MIGLKISRSFFKKWEAKPKLKPPCTRNFSRALRKLQAIARNCDWFIAPFAPVVIGQSNYFGNGFSTFFFWKLLYVMCYLFWFDSGDGPSHHLLERCCCTQHFGLCSRTVDHPARMGEYWSQGVERAVPFYLDYGQLAQHSMLSRFSTVLQCFVGVLTEGHQKRRSVRKTSLPCTLGYCVGLLWFCRCCESLSIGALTGWERKRIRLKYALSLFCPKTLPCWLFYLRIPNSRCWNN